MKMSGAIVHSGVQDVHIEDFEQEPQKPALIWDPHNAPRQPYGCDVCQIKASSLKLLQRHLDGRRHKIKVERFGKTFECDVCEVVANSQSQLDVHLRGLKHRTKVARKERMDFMALSNTTGAWIIIFGVVCIFLNLIVVFKVFL